MACSRPPINHTQLDNGAKTRGYDCGVEKTADAIYFASCGQVDVDAPFLRKLMGKPGKVATDPRDWKTAIESDCVASSVAVLLTVIVPVLKVVVPDTSIPKVPEPEAGVAADPDITSPVMPKSTTVVKGLVGSFKYPLPPVPPVPTRRNVTSVPGEIP